MTATAKIFPSIPRTAKEVFEMLPEGTLAEVIDNTIYMTPPPLTTHQGLSIKLASLIWFYVEEEKKLGTCLAAPTGVYLDDNNIVEPDILFISNERTSIIKNKGIEGAPDLIIEILSSNRKHDLDRKKNLYEKFGVKEYFIVDPLTKETIAYYYDGKKYIQQESKKGKIKSKLLKKTFSF